MFKTLYQVIPSNLFLVNYKYIIYIYEGNAPLFFPVQR